MFHIADRNCHVEPIRKVVDPQALEGSATALLGIMGMGCPNCANRVRNSLLSLPGVLRAEIDLSHGLARVDFDPGSAGHRDLLDAVAAAGDDRHTYEALLI